MKGEERAGGVKQKALLMHACARGAPAHNVSMHTSLTTTQTFRGEVLTCWPSVGTPPERCTCDPTAS